MILYGGLLIGCVFMVGCGSGSEGFEAVDFDAVDEYVIEFDV